eukprot:10082-Heterococcus_DN1.PRE.5
MWGIKSVVRMPLHSGVAAAGDAGVPLVVSHPEGQHAALYSELADAVVSVSERNCPVTAFKP